MKKNRIKFLIIELFLLMLAVFFVWKIFDQNVAETRIAVILPESGDKRWDALIKGMKQAAARWWAQPRSTCFSPSPAPSSRR